MNRLSLLGLLVLVACADLVAPRRLCACSPAEPGALMTGVLTKTDGKAVAGARVQFVARDPRDTLRRVSRSTVTDSAGGFLLYAGGPSEGQVWMQIFVQDTATNVVRRPVPDSVLVWLRFGASLDSTWIALSDIP